MSANRIDCAISPDVARHYVGSTLRLTASVYVDDVLTDASAITFMWKVGKCGTQATITPTRSSTGVYYAEVTPETGGDLFWRWDTEGTLDTAMEGAVNIAATQFTL